MKAENPMKILLLFPSDYFDLQKVDADYEYEYKETVRFPEFEVMLYNYDEFVSGGKLRIYPNDYYTGICVYRGWMLKPQQYETLYKALLDNGIRLINSPEEYNACHLFLNVYDSIKKYTPKSLFYKDGGVIDWEVVNKTFEKFMIKDFVKSVKGTAFPKYFETPVNSLKMNEAIKDFISLRDNLFTGGIVVKEFVDFKRYDDATNEYRAFFLNGKLLSLCRNSNQPDSCKPVPVDFVLRFNSLESNFYTVDFAELEDGSWIVIETGDGQVSGLSPNQYVFKYYDEIRRILESGEDDHVKYT